MGRLQEITIRLFDWARNSIATINTINRDIQVKLKSKSSWLCLKISDLVIWFSINIAKLKIVDKICVAIRPRP